MLSSILSLRLCYSCTHARPECPEPGSGVTSKSMLLKLKAARIFVQKAVVVVLDNSNCFSLPQEYPGSISLTRQQRLFLFVHAD